MDLGIRGRVALVTAASKGLGRGTAVAFGAEGCRVVICARGEAALGEAAAAVEDAGGEVFAIVDDVTEPEAPARLVAATVEHFGGIDIVVGNAGGPPPGRSFDVSDEGIEAAVNANLTSSSIKQPIPSLALSNMARTGLWAWAKTAAQDVIDEGITINLACPGLHDTDRIRALYAEGAVPSRIGDPLDFGRVVAFLCSEPAKFISGSAVQVDGAGVVGLL